MFSSDVPPTVLVIDDSATVRIFASRALLPAGFKVVEAVDGLDGLEKLEALGANVSLVLCDVNMPRMSGIDFLETLAASERYTTGGAKRVPIIMLTTEGHPALIQRAKASGARGWMMKPFQPEQLVAAARHLMAA